MNEFFFIVLPYVVLTLFIVIPIIRRRRGGFAFTTRASGFLERPSIGIASTSFHWGIILLFIAHLMGLIAGLALATSWLDAFHWTGLAAGLAALYGASLALVRRIVVPELRVTSRVDDYVVLCLLITIICLGLYPVIVDKSFGISMTVAPWVKSIVTLSPEVGGMAGLPIVTKIHIILGMVFIGYFPFTKLVHMWTVPLGYLVRPYQSVRTFRKV